MRRFIYTPDVQVFIATQDYGVMNVSRDIIEGTVERKLNQVSTCSFTLQNPYRKYYQKIKPMDRIVVFAQRVHKPVQIFSGYIDDAPYDDLYPLPVHITASCTLKRLLYTYFDPGLPFVANFLGKLGYIYDQTTGSLQSSGQSLFNFDQQKGLGHILVAVLQEVGGWNPGAVHVLPLPPSVITKTRKVMTSQYTALQDQKDEIEAMLKRLMTVQGVMGSAQGGGGSPFLFQSLVEDKSPLPKDLARTYQATIYGSSFNAGPVSASQIDQYLKEKGSPMAGSGQDFVAAGVAYGVDPRFILGLAGQESSFGKALANTFNPFGYGGQGSFKAFSSWADAINFVTSAIAGMPPSNNTNYFKKGKYTVNDIYLGTYCGSGCHTDVIFQTIKDLGGNPDGSMQWQGNPSATPSDAGQTGSVGDVMVPSSFRNDLGDTFRITGGNPYGNDQMLFKAVKVDGSLDKDHIKIYVPGATDLSSPQAQSWKDHAVNLETSAGGVPFPTGGGTPPSPTPGSGSGSGPGVVTMADGANRAGAPLNLDLINFAKRIAGVYGKPLVVTTGTNHDRMTTTGNQSLHWTGDAMDFGTNANNVPCSNNEGDTCFPLATLGQAALIAAGMPEAQARQLTHFDGGNIYGGYEIIFNSSVGGNHYNHLHVGIYPGSAASVANSSLTDTSTTTSGAGQGFVFPLPAGTSWTKGGGPADHKGRGDNWESINAIDIMAPGGTVVLACVSGTITQISGTDPKQGGVTTSSGANTFGWSIHLSGGGNEYFYTHLQNLKVKEGDVVRAGQPIAEIGVGNPWGEHLHFAVKSGNPENAYTGTITGGTSPVLPGQVQPGQTAAFDPSGVFINPAGINVANLTGEQLAKIINSISSETALSVGLSFDLAFPTTGIQAEFFRGERALANDIKLMTWIEEICTASGRVFQSLPNGDFVAFWPNYFGWATEPEFQAYWRITDLELINLSIQLSDRELTTHVFATADTANINNKIDLEDQLASVVASVESIDTFSEFVNVDKNFSPEEFLRRYGARPLPVAEVNIKNPLIQFMYAWITFLDKWARQFVASASITFQPEIYPGTLVEFRDRDLICYVDGVTHTIDRVNGFSTDLSLTAPASTGGRNHMMALNRFGLRPGGQSTGDSRIDVGTDTTTS